MTAAGGCHQNRGARWGTRRVDIRARLDQGAQRLVIAVHRGPDQGRVAAPVDGMHVRAGGKQHVHQSEGTVIGGEEQRRVTVGVLHMHVRAGGNERGRDLGMKALHRYQQRAPAPVCAGIRVRSGLEQKTRDFRVSCLGGGHQGRPAVRGALADIRAGFEQSARHRGMPALRSAGQQPGAVPVAEEIRAVDFGEFRHPRRVAFINRHKQLQLAAVELGILVKVEDFSDGAAVVSLEDCLESDVITCFPAGSGPFVLLFFLWCLFHDPQLQ